MNVLCHGAGGMGALAAATTAGFDEIDKIAVADLEPAAVEGLKAAPALLCSSGNAGGGEFFL